MPIFDTTAFLNQLLYDPKHPLLFNDGFFVFFFAIFIALYYHFRHNLPIRKFIFCAFSLYFFYKASGFFVLIVFLAAIVASISALRYDSFGITQGDALRTVLLQHQNAGGYASAKKDVGRQSYHGI